MTSMRSSWSGQGGAEAGPRRPKTMSSTGRVSSILKVTGPRGCTIDLVPGWVLRTEVHAGRIAVAQSGMQLDRWIRHFFLSCAWPCGNNSGKSRGMGPGRKEG